MKPIITLNIVLALLSISPKVFAQAPNISYPGGPFTFAAGAAITPITVSNSGGTIAINGQTTTLAGSGSAGYVNASGTAAYFNQPLGVVADASGNLYVTDVGNQRIRKIDPTGAVTTFAGTGAPGAADGTGTGASFYHPVGMCIDASGNIYVADEDNNMIRKITPAGVVTTLTGQTGAGYTNGLPSVAKFNLPCGVAVDAAGNVYVADYNNNAIRKVTPTGSVSTFAGSATGASGSANGTGTAATFNHPFSVAIDASGNLYVADRSNNMIRKITSGGVVTTLAGQVTAGYADATGVNAKFNVPTTVVADKLGNVYVADETNNRIRKIVVATGAVTTLSGTGATGSSNSIGTASTFYNPFGITADASNNLYVTDYSNNLVRKVVSTAFSIGSSLPAGLSFDVTTGTISGTPAATSFAANYSVTAYSTTVSSNSTTSLNLTIDAAGSVNPSNGYNYVATYTPRVANLNVSTSLNTAALDKSQVEVDIQYLDGLGRPLQTVQAKGSPTGKDIVQTFAYDQLGRDSVAYLPFTTSNTPGAYQANALAGIGGYTGGSQYQFYQQTGQGYVNTAHPVSGTNYEPSPLNRVIEKGAPGDPWQLSNSGVTGAGHTVKLVYTLNNSTSFGADSVNGTQVAYYYATANADNSRTLHNSNYYAANTLTVTISKDENWTTGRAGTVEEYKDITGHVVLKRVYNYKNSAVEVLSTYYVYDEFGQLSFVLPPASGADGAGAISSITLSNLCYQYQYDERLRLVQKHIPGKDWEYVVYNALDKPVATQDANQRANNQWVITKYDVQGRAALSGTWNNGGTSVTRASLQGTVKAIVTNLWEAPVTTGNGYNGLAWPTANITATLSLNYYDNQNNAPGLPGIYVLGSGVSTMTRGLPTAKKTAVLNNPSDMLWDVIYYDDLGRTTTTYTQHYLGGTLTPYNFDAVITSYNFTNAPTKVTRKHFVKNAANTATVQMLAIANTYMYDHVGRRIKNWEQITNGTNTPTTKTLISKIDYNEIGQVLTKHLHSTDSVNFLQNIAYTYNERGWLLTSSAALFTLNLYYNTSSTPQYNGNIMHQFWGFGPTVTNHYNYLYDNLNRLLNGGATTANNENSIIYDKMGNLTRLYRYQIGTIVDQLAYGYTSGGNATNQLQFVTDASSSTVGLVPGTTYYTYDGNGNMLTQTNSVNTIQNKTFTYNLLNLPQTVAVNGGTLTYTYDAAGNKLRKVAVINSITTATDYINGIQYKNNGTTLDFIPTEEGKAVPNGTDYNYTYYLGDNLGNTRVTFETRTGVAAAIQTDDYYPFGMEISNTLASPKNEYLYNKKELQEELGQYDYGARFYDPVIGRWTSVDPLVESGQESGTPYGYVFDDPIKYTDPDGRAPDITIEGTNNSSVTIQTSLVNTTVHIGIDLHGNHTINGERALQTGLDLVSLVDPTGLASAASGAISLKNGEYLDALTSFAGAIPLLGKLADGIKVEKDVAAIEKLTNEGEKVLADGEKVGEIPKSPKGKGSVDPSERDPQRNYTKKQKAEMLEKQGGKCPGCGEPKKLDEVHGHHLDRHADGGRTTTERGASVCKSCHTKIHQ